MKKYNIIETSFVVHDVRGVSTGKHVCIRKVFSLYYQRGYFWFRFFGKYGVNGKGPMFLNSFFSNSNYGYNRYLGFIFVRKYSYGLYFKIFGWRFTPLIDGRGGFNKLRLMDARDYKPHWAGKYLKRLKNK